ncbi:hypothetical protein J3F83DRAFT_162728 [Trichoderma novae-zelandiae]
MFVLGSPCIFAVSAGTSTGRKSLEGTGEATAWGTDLKLIVETQFYGNNHHENNRNKTTTTKTKTTPPRLVSSTSHPRLSPCIKQPHHQQQRKICGSATYGVVPFYQPVHLLRNREPAPGAEARPGQAPTAAAAAADAATSKRIISPFHGPPPRAASRAPSTALLGSLFASSTLVFPRLSVALQLLTVYALFCLYHTRTTHALAGIVALRLESSSSTYELIALAFTSFMRFSFFQSLLRTTP